MRIAFIGIGLMGKPMVRNLVKAGHELHLWNRSPNKAEMLCDIATIHSSPVEAVKKAQVVITMLADGPITSEILINQGVVNATPKGALIIDMGSVEPAVDLKIAQLVTSQNKRFLDAPVSGVCRVLKQRH